MEQTNINLTEKFTDGIENSVYSFQEIIERHFILIDKRFLNLESEMLEDLKTDPDFDLNNSDIYINTILKIVNSNDIRYYQDSKLNQYDISFDLSFDLENIFTLEEVIDCIKTQYDIILNG